MKVSCLRLERVQCGGGEAQADGATSDINVHTLIHARTSFDCLLRFYRRVDK